MKKKLFTLLFLVLSTTCFAQIDSTIFKGTLTNKEYNVYLKIDFYDQNIKVPGQEIFGDMAGFFGDYKDGRKWLFWQHSQSGKIDGIPKPVDLNVYAESPKQWRIFLKQQGIVDAK